MAAALLISIALVSGCGSGVVDFSGSRSAANPPTHSVVQRDKRPVLERFPKLGNITDIEWDEVPLGSASSRIPGPTDYRLSGVAHLTKEEVRHLQQDYDWEPAKKPPTVVESIAPFVPKGAAWKVSKKFTSVVTDDLYTATFHFDPQGQVVVFNVVIS
ncbi:hypothetical protein [Microtetraspora malaysiensis]|uniref:hypothetical protein n=1 Tax=Microtetraspora malaysiensis TaxID=161358 RepID=UPI003D8F4739